MECPICETGAILYPSCEKILYKFGEEEVLVPLFYYTCMVCGSDTADSYLMWLNKEVLEECKEKLNASKQ